MKRHKLLKPWNMVLVNTGARRFVGELVSFPIPEGTEGTIMVRQVPSVAATMLEVPTSWIEAPVAGYPWIHYAEVSGPGALPVDMLRYDYAVPFNFTLDDATGLYTMEPDWEGKPLVVAAMGRYKTVPAFTPKRWESFGWRCHLLKVDRVPTGGAELSA